MSQLCCDLPVDLHWYIRLQTVVVGFDLFYSILTQNGNLSNIYEHMLKSEKDSQYCKWVDDMKHLWNNPSNDISSKLYSCGSVQTIWRQFDEEKKSIIATRVFRAGWNLDIFTIYLRSFVLHPFIKKKS